MWKIHISWAAKLNRKWWNMTRKITVPSACSTNQLFTRASASNIQVWEAKPGTQGTYLLLHLSQRLCSHLLWKQGDQKSTSNHVGQVHIVKSRALPGIPLRLRKMDGSFSQSAVTHKIERVLHSEALQAALLTPSISPRRFIASPTVMSWQPA